jgi:hypothetical protein
MAFVFAVWRPCEKGKKKECEKILFRGMKINYCDIDYDTAPRSLPHFLICTVNIEAIVDRNLKKNIMTSHLRIFFKSVSHNSHIACKKTSDIYCLRSTIEGLLNAVSLILLLIWVIIASGDNFTSPFFVLFRSMTRAMFL